MEKEVGKREEGSRYKEWYWDKTRRNVGNVPNIRDGEKEGGLR